MKILILGVGRMGSWLAWSWAKDHEMAVLDADPKKCESISNCQIITQLEQIRDFKPDLLLNAVGLRSTIKAFESALPFLNSNCILSDIASVKSDLMDFYESTGFRFVSTHPMFGPTFGDLNNLEGQNAVVIQESCEEGKDFFMDFYTSLNLNIFKYSFAEHDQEMSLSLATPYISTLAFASCMKKLEASGTTFKKHLSIVHGMLSEDRDELVTEILFDDLSILQSEQIHSRMADLITILKSKDRVKMKAFLAELRSNVDFGKV